MSRSPGRRSRNILTSIPAPAASCSPKTPISLPCMRRSNTLSMWSSTATETSPVSSAEPPAKWHCATCWPAPTWNPLKNQTKTNRTTENPPMINSSCGACPERSRRVGHSCPTPLTLLLNSRISLKDAFYPPHEAPWAGALSSYGQQFTRPSDRVALDLVARQKLKSVPQSVRIPHQRAQFQRSRTHRQCQLQRRHFPRLQLTGQRDPNPILPKFNRPSPKLQHRVRPEHFDRNSNVQGIAREPPQPRRVFVDMAHLPRAVFSAVGGLLAALLKRIGRR